LQDLKTPARSSAKPVYFYVLYRTQLVRTEHNFLFAVWLVSSTNPFCIQHSLSESSTFLYLQFGLYEAQLPFCFEHNLSDRAQFFICSWLVTSTTSFLYRTQLIRIEHNFLFVSSTIHQIEHESLSPTAVTPCSLARGSDVQTSEYHKRLCDVLTSKLRRRPRVNEQHGVRIKPAIYHELFVRIKDRFCFFHDFAFLLFQTLSSSINFCHFISCFLKRDFYFMARDTFREFFYSDPLWHFLHGGSE
jgi:hypothetical protein